MKAVLTPKEFPVRFFLDGEVDYGKTPWVGSADVTVDELMAANVTRIIILSEYSSQDWYQSLYTQMRALGIKCAWWTKITNDRKRVVRLPIKENCTAADLAYYNAQIKLDRERERAEAIITMKEQT